MMQNSVHQVVLVIGFFELLLLCDTKLIFFENPSVFRVRETFYPKIALPETSIAPENGWLGD